MQHQHAPVPVWYSNVDMDMDSVSSFGGPKDKELPRNKPTQRHAWVGDAQVKRLCSTCCSGGTSQRVNPTQQVNHENFQRMLDEYRAAKASEKSMCTKIKQ